MIDVVSGRIDEDEIGSCSLFYLSTPQLLSTVVYERLRVDGVELVAVVVVVEEEKKIARRTYKSST